LKILVTGGAGFIGKHLVKSLIEKGNEVTIFDNYSNSSKKSISHLIEMGVKSIEGDITNITDIFNATKNQDTVIHLAAKISVDESIKNPDETFNVNVEGTRNVLTVCFKNHIKNLIVSSSAAIYGETESPEIKIKEETEKKPISPYGKSKLKMEEIINKFVLDHGINCVILRFFNIYGIGQTPEYAGVITKFIQKIKQNKDLEIFGNGMQIRDFVSINDIINSIHNTLSYDKSGTYNIASGDAITIKELAEKMISSSKKNIKIHYTSPKNGDIKYSQADITLAKNELGYFPKFKLEQINELLD